MGATAPPPQPVAEHSERVVLPGRRSSTPSRQPVGSRPDRRHRRWLGQRVPDRHALGHGQGGVEEDLRPDAWTVQTIASILRSGLIAGLREHNGVVVAEGSGRRSSTRSWVRGTGRRGRCGPCRALRFRASATRRRVHGCRWAVRLDRRASRDACNVRRTDRSLGRARAIDGPRQGRQWGAEERRMTRGRSQCARALVERRRAPQQHLNEKEPPASVQSSGASSKG